MANEKLPQYTFADIMLAALPEMWKDVPGYEGLYMVSTYGRVAALEKSYYCGNPQMLRHKKAHVLKQTKTEDGYVKVALTHKGARQDMRVHRIVGITFLENKNNKPEINHKNLDKKFNYLFNLEWNTRSENNKHAFDNGANDIRKYNAGKPPCTRLCIDIETGIFYDTIKDAALAKGIKRSTLDAMLAGRFKNRTSIRYA